MKSAFNPFRVPLSNPVASGAVESLLGLKKLIRYYDQRPESADGAENSVNFLNYTMDVLGCGLNPVYPEHLDEIPKEGPVIFVANHPLGGLEGVAMTEMLVKIRPDLKVLTNEMLTRIPELSELFIGVDVLSKNAAAANAKGIRAACKQLSSGGALLIYPAGMVSAIDTKLRKIRDRQWDSLVGRLAKKYKATCVPFFVDGRNSSLFYLAGLVHPRLRTLMLPRELSNKQGKRFDLIVGQPIAPRELDHLESDQAITDYLRIATDLLPNSSNQTPLESVIIEGKDIIQPSQQDELLEDLAKLEEFKLIDSGTFSVYCAPYQRLGKMMDVIARSREVTFRAAGEGTGRAMDVDHYDPHYQHLFLWDNEAQALVGGYRIGCVDEIVSKHGLKGLYSRSHYHYDERYLQRIGNALEMGRSFVTPEYQRHPRALDLLWKGIGAYVAKNPHYHTLFGCVSISKEHSILARAFLSDSMMTSFRAEQEFLMDIRPVVPLKVKGKLWTPESLASISNIAAINKLLGRCDPGKSVPILLRHYLALNGRFVCFSVNTGFNDSLDGLILVDLRKSPEKYIKRYLGKDGAEKFLQLWNQHETAA
ncbi:lysophospholipid acyltransferase family protein [Sessilibacter corallicola]|uniref:L-ornithine N(alpha)-acyltransferase n=1 Tax=Sessilibacter corallicola TaxID=2904075 RepID=A0ABQ0AAQ6_9GAMM|nr:GNAT family N-acyltransferase [Sessilibacter corallicola]MCE2028167.1 lysophospholipid acyltransferase family protein [Sessilibacter corallicola]